MDKLKNEAIKLKEDLYQSLETACKSKLSTADITPERLLWEFYNKLFTILQNTENSIILKDSLSIHLVARYSYELLITFLYIFLDENKTEERTRLFLNFNNFTSETRTWSERTFTKMLEDLPESNWLDFHKNHYKSLSNFAHPTMDSFNFNRKGEKVEFHLIVNTASLVYRQVIEVVRVSRDKKLFFTNEEMDVLWNDVCKYSKRIEKISKDLSLSL